MASEPYLRSSSSECGSRRTDGVCWVAFRSAGLENRPFLALSGPADRDKECLLSAEERTYALQSEFA
jgi:hypothetical protein